MTRDAPGNETSSAPAPETEAQLSAASTINTIPPDSTLIVESGTKSGEYLTQTRVCKPTWNSGSLLRLLCFSACLAASFCQWSLKIAFCLHPAFASSHDSDGMVWNAGEALPATAYGCPYPPSDDGECTPPMFCNCFDGVCYGSCQGGELTDVLPSTAGRR